MRLAIPALLIGLAMQPAGAAAALPAGFVTELFDNGFRVSILPEPTNPMVATQVWYHALQNLWSTADFADGVDVIVRSAQILTKNSVVPEGTTQTVRAAFKEVGLY